MVTTDSTVRQGVESQFPRAPLWMFSIPPYLFRSVTSVFGSVQRVQTTTSTPQLCPEDPDPDLPVPSSTFSTPSTVSPPFPAEVHRVFRSEECPATQVRSGGVQPRWDLRVRGRRDTVDGVHWVVLRWGVPPWTGLTGHWCRNSLSPESVAYLESGPTQPPPR